MLPIHFFVVCYHHLLVGSFSPQATQLVYGGTLEYPFQPEKLHLGANGRLYHPSPVGDRALIRSSMALSLIEQLTVDSSGQQVLEWQGGRFLLGQTNSVAAE